MKAPVTRSEEGGIYDRVKAHDRVKEGGIRWGRSMAWERGSMAPMVRWRERRRRRCHWLSEAGRKGGTQPGGPAQPAWPLGAKKAGWASWPLGRLGQKLKKNSFLIKIEFLNVPRLWKFAQRDLGGIWTQGFFLNSSRHLK
jgi:hypothetical protein